MAASSPKTPRGERARAQLLEAGREVFEQDGYFSAKVVDIVEKSGLSIGSFYRYFNSKEELLEEIMLSVSDEIYQSARRGWDRADIRGSLYNATLGFLEGYQAYSAVLVAIYEYMRTSPEAAEMWHDSRARVWNRIEGYVRTAIEDNNDPIMEPHIATLALSGMVSSLALRMFVEPGNPQVEIEAAARVLSEVWYRAIFAGEYF